MASSRKITKVLIDAGSRETELLLEKSSHKKCISYFYLLPIECFHFIENKLDAKSFFSLASTSKKIADKMGINEQSKYTLNKFIYYYKQYHAIDHQYKYTLLGNTGKTIFSVSIIGFALAMEILVCMEGEAFNSAMKMDKDDYFRSAIYILGSFICGLIAFGGVVTLYSVKKLSLLSEKREIAGRGRDLFWGMTLNDIINPGRHELALANPDSDQDLDLMEQGLRPKK